jgi:ABC-type thiamin/hydroxymethylpyrimidine transport system permease subunit
MELSRAQRPIGAAAVSLAACGAMVAALVPPLNHYTMNSVPLVVIISLGIAVSFILHLIFIGMAARQLGRSAALWVIVAICFVPVASIIGLILFEWFSEEKNHAAGVGSTPR